MWWLARVADSSVSAPASTFVSMCAVLGLWRHTPPTDHVRRTPLAPAVAKHTSFLCRSLEDDPGNTVSLSRTTRSSRCSNTGMVLREQPVSTSQTWTIWSRPALSKMWPLSAKRKAETALTWPFNVITRCDISRLHTFSTPSGLAE